MRFKPGDSARIIKAASHPFLIGSICTIIKFSDDVEMDYAVEIEGFPLGKHSTWQCDDNALEPLKDTDPSQTWEEFCEKINYVPDFKVTI